MCSIRYAVNVAQAVIYCQQLDNNSGTDRCVVLKYIFQYYNLVEVLFYGEYVDILLCELYIVHLNGSFYCLQFIEKCICKLFLHNH